MTEVNEFMASLEHPLKEEIEAVRAIILAADTRISEGIKWNAPSFFVSEHFATFRLRPLPHFQIIFHTGAKKRTNGAKIEISDPADLLHWITKDRGTITLANIEEIRAHEAALQSIVQQWLAQM